MVLVHVINQAGSHSYWFFQDSLVQVLCPQIRGYEIHWQDWVVDKEMDQELNFAQKEELNQRKDLLKDSIKILKK